MPRFLKVAAAQMGPDNEGTPREEIVDRIISPQGQVLARAATTGDELVTARIDLDQMLPVRKSQRNSGDMPLSCMLK